MCHVIILDGTMSTMKQGCETNAGLTFKLLKKAGASDVTLYYEPGLQWADWRGTRDIITGRGINRQIRRAYGVLASRFKPGDKIILMGFSRGAYAVRSLAGVIDRVGLLTAQNATERNIRTAYRLYRDPTRTAGAVAFANSHCHPEVEIEMIGAWDTVKALGFCPMFLRPFESTKHDFHNHELGPHIRHGYQALALNETRVAYDPVIWETGVNCDCDNTHVEQVWFRGTHGDVGGQLNGFHAARPLANIPLVWMLERAEKHGLTLPDNWQADYPTDASAPSVGNWRGWGKILWFRAPRKVGEDASERIHDTAFNSEFGYDAVVQPH
ncbi:MAG: DUF2235 domain-containing protein [Pseudomonadota bacterium]